MNDPEFNYRSRSERIGRVLMVWSALGLFLLGLLLLLIPLRTRAASQLLHLPGQAADNGGAVVRCPLQVACPPVGDPVLRG